MVGISDTQKLHIGDTIKCLNADDMVDTMYKLMHCDIETDFMYEKDGEKGLWLVIEKIS